MRTNLKTNPRRVRKLLTCNVLALAPVLGICSSALSDGKRVSPSDLPPLCKENQVPRELAVPFGRQPSYFFMTYGEDKVLYIANNTNYGFDLTEKDPKKREVVILGPYDPVPSPDQKIVSFPEANGPKKLTFGEPPSPGTYRGMGLFLGQDLDKQFHEQKAHPEKTQEPVPPQVIDDKLGENYQSIGTTEHAENNPNHQSAYRMIVQSDGKLYIRDYTLTPDPEHKTAKIHAASDKTQICAGEGELHLPRISRDGTRFSAFNDKSQTTKIYELDYDAETKKWNCEEMLDLGTAVGKADFSYDGKMIAFHVDNFSVANGSMFESMQPGQTKEVYAAKLETYRDRNHRKKLRIQGIAQLTTYNGTDRGSYYPSFTPSGKVVMIEKTGQKDFQFVRVDPSQAEFLPYPFPAERPDPDSSDTLITQELLGIQPEITCDPDDKRALAFMALGQVWLDVCSKLPRSGTTNSLPFYSLGLDPDACKKWVNEMWSTSVAKLYAKTIEAQQKTKNANFDYSRIAELTQEDLINACPSGKGPKPASLPPNSNVAKFTQLNERRTAQQVLDQVCNTCHRQGGTHPLVINSNTAALQNDEGSALRERIRARLRRGPNRMPPPWGMAAGAPTLDEQDYKNLWKFLYGTDMPDEESASR